MMCRTNEWGVGQRIRPILDREETVKNTARIVNNRCETGDGNFSFLTNKRDKSLNREQRCPHELEKIVIDPVDSQDCNPL